MKNEFTLREGATHVGTCHKVRKSAFTLAEVLITLGIIGVVAALTIPTLISEYQKKQWVSGLQKGYATLNNAFRMAMATDGVDQLSQTTLWSKIDDDGYLVDNANEFVAELSNYLKITKFCNPDRLEQEGCFVKYKLLNGEYNGMENDLTIGGRLKIYTADGMTYFLRIGDGGLDIKGLKQVGRIEIDVNGDSAPNQYGRDLFEVVVYDNGKIMFPGTNEWVELSNGNHWSDEGVPDKVCKSNPAIPDDYYYVSYCGARIFENGWRMDY